MSALGKMKQVTSNNSISLEKPMGIRLAAQYISYFRENHPHRRTIHIADPPKNHWTLQVPPQALAQSRRMQ